MARVVSELETVRPTVALACTSSGHYAGFPLPGNAVRVICLQAIHAEPVDLYGAHARPVTALCFSDDDEAAGRGSSPVLLCTASRDIILLWHVEDAYAAASMGENPRMAAILCDSQGPVEALTLDPTGRLLAACVECIILIIDVLKTAVVFRLEGHIAKVTAAAFCFTSTALGPVVVSVAEDRTFKLWDLEAGALLYQSAIISASPFTALAMDPSFPRFAVGSNDGKVRFFDLTSPGCRCMQVVDVGAALEKAQAVEVAAVAVAEANEGPKVISSQPAWRLKDQMAYQAAMLGGDGDDDSSRGDEAGMGETSLAVSVLFFCHSTPGAGRGSDEDEDELEGSRSHFLGESPRLLVGMPRALVALNTHTYELCSTVLFQESTVASVSGLCHLPVDTARSQCYGMREGVGISGPGRSIVQGCIASAFRSMVTVVQVDLFGVEASNGSDDAAIPVSLVGRAVTAADAQKWQQRQVQLQQRKQWEAMRPPAGVGNNYSSSGGEAAGGSAGGVLAGDVGQMLPGPGVLSVFPTQPLPENSPLRAEYNTDKGDKAASASKSNPNSKWNKRRSPSFGGSGSGGGSLVDKPVTFHTRIKSSGYGSSPARLPSRSGPDASGSARARPTPPRSQSASISGPPSGRRSAGGAKPGAAKNSILCKQYPVTCGPLVEYQAKHSMGNAPLHGGPIMRLAFSEDGCRLATASADKTARVMRLPVAKYGGEGTDYIGHNGAVNTVAWSNDSTLMLTGSSDRTVRLWQVGKADPAIDLAYVQRSPKPDSQKPNAKFLSEVRNARFHYLDRFILLAAGSRVYMYKYLILNLESEKNDIIRLQANKNKYKLVTSFQSSANAVQDFANINGFYSNLLLMAGSNRAVEVHDMAVGVCVRQILDAHARPVHTIRMHGASAYVTHPKEVRERLAYVTHPRKVRARLAYVTHPRKVRARLAYVTHPRTVRALYGVSA
eukprot:jgi/Mesvir1/2163/Mv16675-RA.2